MSFGSGRIDDVAERLYSQSTAATQRKRTDAQRYRGFAGNPNSVELGSLTRNQRADFDVKAEVDRMYANIMASLQLDDDGGEQWTTEEVLRGDFSRVSRPGSSSTAAREVATTTDQLKLMPRASAKIAGHLTATSPPPAATTVDIRGVIKPLPLNQLGSTFGSSRREVLSKVKKSDAPGPGSYSVPSSARSSGSATPRWTKPTTSPRQSRKLADVPGPGEYKVPSSFEEKKPSSQKGTFPHAPLERVKPQAGQIASTPGPGTYDLDSMERHRRQRSPSPSAAGFGSTADRMPPVRSSSPGPGAYRVEEVVGTSKDGPAVSMPKAPPRPVIKSDTPGPGAYRVSPTTATRDQYIRGVIPTAGRRPDEWCGTNLNPDGPGPGAYRPSPLETGPQITIKGPVPKASHTAQVPGPGAYSPELATEKPSSPMWTFSGKHPEKPPEPTPGPADYIVDSIAATETAAPSVRFGTAPRETASPTEDVPGPGAYLVLPSTVKVEAKSGVIGTEQRITGPQGIEETSKTPGPGAYQTTTTIGADAPSAFILGKPKPVAATSDITPGPGYYDLTAMAALREGKGAVPFGTAVRDTAGVTLTGACTTDMVGPGAYQLPDLDRGPAWTMLGPHPTSKNALDGGGSPDNVGPGAYDPHPTLSNAPAATFGTAPKFEKPPAMEVPGPGAYSPLDPTPGDPAYPFPTAPRMPTQGAGIGSTPATLGPGSYFFPPVSSTIGGDISRAQRFSHGPPPGHDIPGPGTYEPLDLQSIPSVVFPRGEARPENKEAEAIPGPGAYFVNDAATKAGAPVAVIGTGPARPEPDFGKVPGPGSYSPQFETVEPRTPAAIFPITAHATSIRQDDPVGPGAYDPHLPQDTAPAATFGTAQRMPSAASNDVPAPGSYFVDPSLTEERAPSAIMLFGQRHQPELDNCSPGPGAYVVSDEHVRPSAPAISFGTSHRQDQEPNIVPGPGAYSPVDPTVHVPTVVLHSSPRYVEVKDPGPGPGAYTPHSPLGVDSVAVGFARAMREINAMMSDAPGPGAYEPQLDAVTERLPAVSFSTAPRDLPNPTKDVPGPGAYAPSDPRDTAPSITFGTEKRGKVPGEPESIAPGPGAYHPHDPTLVSPAAFISTANFAPLAENCSPGPGAYQPTLPPRGPQAPSFGTAQRQANVLLQGADAPGPGSYDVVLPPETPAYSFSTGAHRPEPALGKDAPGPGAYCPESYRARDGPSVTISTGPGHNTKPPTADIPGPGAYNVSGEREGPIVFFGTEPRFIDPFADQALPGPGAYVVGEARPPGPAITFGKSRREEGPTMGADAPGPGTYNVASPNDAPSVSINPAPSTFSRVETAPSPGPGHYDNPVLRSGPEVMFSRTGHFSVSNDTPAPGPGAYEIKSLGADVPNAPAYSFPRSGRVEPGLEEAALRPGPGTYDIATRSDAPAVSIQGKWPEAKTTSEVTPGPGAYHLQTPNEAPAYSIPKAASGVASEAEKGNLPGPGSYHLGTTLSPVAVTIPKAGRVEPDALTRDLPGPGQYDLERVTVQYERPPAFPFPTSERPGLVPLNQTPGVGPGSYDLRLPSDAPAHAFPHAQRTAGDPRPNPNNGPGEYDLFLKPDTPLWTIPKATPGDGPGKPAPGPGQYYVPYQFDPAKGASMGGKWADQSKERFPGPGAYYLGDYDPYKRDLATVIDFSRGGPVVRSTLVRTAGGPGPGEYMGPVQFYQGGVTIHQRFPEPYLEATPGPPDYYPQQGWKKMPLAENLPY